jgi:transposase
MGKSKYTVHLADDQRSFLEGLTHRGKSAASTIRHAYILLHADKPDPEVAAIVRCHPQSVFNIRKTFVTRGLDAALHRKIRDAPPRPRKLDGEGEARLLQIACSEPPEGYGRWTLQLLADRLVELQIVESISIKTVERTLKKTRSSRIRRSSGLSRPKKTGTL